MDYKQENNDDINKTRVLPKVEKKKKSTKMQYTSKIFPAKFFTYDNKPKNFSLSIAVTSMKMFLIFLLVIMFAGAGTLFGIASAYVETSPIVDTAALTDVSKSSVIYDTNGKEIMKYSGAENRVWVKIDDMPENLVNAFISIEDTRFYSHEGIDYKRLIGAFIGNLQSSSVQGGSTISQQLVKLSMLTSERSYKRKIQEAYMTMILESKYTKDQILESYLNTILLGSNNYGVQAAANDYFGKDVSQLTIRECAMLAGITQSPNAYNPRTNYYVKNTPEKVNDRTDIVIRSMYAAGRITQEEMEQALNEKVNVLKTSTTNTNKLNYAYFVEYAVSDIIDHLIVQRELEDTKANRSAIENELRTKGYKIYLTIDTKVQDTVQDTLSSWTRYPKVADSSKSYITQTIGNETIKLEQPQAAAVVYDYRNGEYKAIVGGRDIPKAEKLTNRAMTNASSVGSSIKPLTVYGPALDKGLTPESLVSNKKQAIPGWNTSTGYPSGSGPNSMVTIREALVQSMNRSAVRLLLEEVTVDTAYNYLVELGIDEKNLNKDASGLALGSSAITPVQLSAAFGAIANTGEYMLPLSFTKVTDSEGNVLLDGKALQEESKKQVYKKSTAYLLTNMLVEAVQRGTGTGAKISGMTVAGKTGTNNDYRAIGFTGFTPYYSATVYIGHDNNASLSNAYAGSYAAPLWSSFMSKIHKGLSDKPIIDASAKELGLVEINVCKITGLLATDSCKADINGDTPTSNYTLKDSVPTEQCNAHKTVSVCKDTLKMASSTCPMDKQIQITILDKTDKVDDTTYNSYMKKLNTQYLTLNLNASCSESHTVQDPIDTTTN